MSTSKFKKMSKLKPYSFETNQAWLIKHFY